MEEKIVFIPANKNFSILLLENIISLKTKGNYLDKIVVLNYGIREDIKSALKNYENIYFIEIEEMEKEKIVCDRFFRVDDYINTNTDKKSVVLFLDCDTWTNADINHPFSILDEKNKNILFTTYNPVILENQFDTFTWHGKHDYIEKFKINIELLGIKYKGVINGAVLFATNAAVNYFVGEFNRIFKRRILKNDFGSDERIFNLIFNELNHSVLDRRWNITLTNNGIYNSPYETAKVIHLANDFKHIKKARFSGQHPEIFNNEIKKLGLKTSILDTCPSLDISISKSKSNYISDKYFIKK